MLKYLVVRATGQIFTIQRTAGLPARVDDSWRGTVATFTVTDGRVTGISTADGGSLSYTYGGDGALESVTLDAQPIRSYTTTDGQLTKVRDGSGRILESHGFAAGAAISTQSAGKHVTGVTWDAGSPRVPGEQVVQVNEATGALTTYYLRQVGDRLRPVEVRGDCACSGNDHVYRYDLAGNVILEQDARGYLTRSTYTTDGRKVGEERRLMRAACDPASFTQEPSPCLLDADALAALEPGDLMASSAATSRRWVYGDASWPDQVTLSCTPSVFADATYPDRETCTSTTYDGTTGEWLTRTESGWTGTSADDAVPVSTTIERTLNNGVMAAPFDPDPVGSYYADAWLSEPQPAGLVRSVDGPRPNTPVADVTEYLHYPKADVGGAAVPAALRGRLAAFRDPLVYVTRYED